MIIAIFWILFALAAILPVRWVVYFFFIGLAFGTFNTLPGGFNLLPYSATAPLLAARLLGERGAGHRLGDALLNPLRFGLLTAFVLYALIITATAPALFSTVIVVPMNNTVESPLHYGMSNLAQAIYLVTAWLVAVSVYVLIRRPGGLQILAHGLLLGGASVAIAGAADMLTAGSGLLAPLRTATYALIDGAEMGGMRRVIGFDSEASTYGGISLFFAATLLFVRPARFAGPLCKAVEPVLMLALFVFCFLSTSSSAYLGLAATGVLFAGSLVLQAATASHSLEGHRATLILMGMVVLLWAGVLAVLFHPALARPLQQVVNEAVIHKVGTDSYIERMRWSRISMTAMLHSGGYGVGLGSSRTSSFPVAVAASTGVFGAALLALYLARGLLAPLGPGCTHAEDVLARDWRRAVVGARLGFLVWLVPAGSVGTAVDLSTNAVFFAIMATAGLALPGIAGQRGADGPGRATGRGGWRAARAAPAPAPALALALARDESRAASETVTETTRLRAGLHLPYRRGAAQ